MKRFIKYIALACTAAAFCSCNDVLNIDPSDRFSEKVIWGSQSSVDQFIYGFYANLRETCEIGQNRAVGFTDAYSDIIKSPSWDQYSHRFNMSLLQESSFSAANAGAHECWSDCYGMIRRRNEFLRDAARHTEFGEDFLKPRIAEVRVLKAWNYYRLIRVYGGVVLRESLDGPEANDKPRSTEAESWQYVINELQEAALDLPTSWESGRITKQAAYGFLSRVAVFAGQWDVAVEAANKCREFGGTLESNYADVFENSESPENLIVVNFNALELGHNVDNFFRPVGDREAHKNAPIYGAFGPTSKLVDSYEMADGTPFSWTEHGDDPYTGREPRFYVSILYNGAQWEGRTIETFVGGVDGITEWKATGTTTTSCTGYYLRKYITEDDHSWDKNSSAHFCPVLRYAEVLLNKAEALAQQDWSANKTAAEDALNEVRARVNLPERHAESLEEFMSLIEHERMVELAGEGLRFWDLRRWRRAVDEINGKVEYGCKITRSEVEVPSEDPEGEPTIEYKYKYDQVCVDGDRTRIFLEKYYYFSVPETERSNNALFGENNPGW